MGMYPNPPKDSTVLYSVDYYRHVHVLSIFYTFGKQSQRSYFRSSSEERIHDSQ